MDEIESAVKAESGERRAVQGRRWSSSWEGALASGVYGNVWSSAVELTQLRRVRGGDGGRGGAREMRVCVGQVGEAGVVCVAVCAGVECADRKE